MGYYAHSIEGVSQEYWHCLRNHLYSTAEIARTNAAPFGAGDFAYVAGLFHDIGKYSEEFQERLKGGMIRVDHSTAGAIEAKSRFGIPGIILAYVIAGHHCGLMNGGSKADESSLDGRLHKNNLPDYSAYSSEISVPITQLDPKLKGFPISPSFSLQFLTRFIYSALVDADFLDTEKALNPDKAALRASGPQLNQLEMMLDRYLNELARGSVTSPVNSWRAKVLNSCRDKSSSDTGLFTLTVPTGGGKTLSSLAFAIRHAIIHGLRRVIYVIPFTSIIEQNAGVFKRVFGEEVVLEHHSNFVFPEGFAQEGLSEYVSHAADKLKLASENWDVPIVATTNVQFFESLFSAESSRCRKLHNISRSVIIVDEAQMVPTGYLKPCLGALVELVENYGSTVVLCTATQPSIEKLLPGSVKVTEIIDQPIKLYEALRRVKVVDLGRVSDDELSDRILSHKQVLCIVNSKKHARLLFEKLYSENSYHLSTRMCPVHRSEVLQTIRRALGNGQTCRVVSTQLIEAGVDVDFPVVYRSSAGIDSIAQSAGRCNREGTLKQGQLYVFQPEKHGLPAGWLSRTASIGEQIFDKYRDPLSPEAVNAYFSALYDVEGQELDKKGVMDAIEEGGSMLDFPFRDLSDKFKLIERDTIPIIIPWDDECKKLLDNVRWATKPWSFEREFQVYTVNVYRSEFKDMVDLGMIEQVGERFFCLSQQGFEVNYSPEVGLIPFTSNMLLNENLII